MAGVYSERILLWSSIGDGPTFTVPAGRRVVVKAVSSNNANTVASAVIIKLNGLSVWAVVLQGQSAVATPMFALVAYAGETLRLSHSQTNHASQASGYMFEAPLLTELQDAQLGIGPAVTPA